MADHLEQRTTWHSHLVARQLTDVLRDRLRNLGCRLSSCTEKDSGDTKYWSTCTEIFSFEIDAILSTAQLLKTEIEHQRQEARAAYTAAREVSRG